MELLGPLAPTEVSSRVLYGLWVTTAAGHYVYIFSMLTLMSRNNEDGASSQ